MKCLTSLATIAAVGLLAGCSANTVDSTGTGQQPETSNPRAPSGQNAAPPESPSKPPATVPAAALDVDANLRALRDLQVFEISGIVENIPESANCYSLACPGHEKEFNDAKTRAAEALAAFTHLALAAASDKESDLKIMEDGRCYINDQQNLQVLRDLHVVRVGDLVLEKPGQNQNCYYAPYGQKLARIADAVARKR